MKQFALIVVMAALAASCNTKSGAVSSDTSGQDSMMHAQMTQDSMTARNKAVVIANLNALNSPTHDLKSIFDAVSPDVVEYGDGTGAALIGLDSTEAGLKSFLDAFPDDRVDSMTVIAEGNHVGVYALWTGTFKNPLMGVKPTGKSFRYWDFDLFTFNNAGQIISHRNVMPGWVQMEMVGIKRK